MGRLITYSPQTMIERKNVVSLVRTFVQVVRRILEAKLQIAGSVGDPPSTMRELRTKLPLWACRIGVYSWELRVNATYLMHVPELLWWLSAPSTRRGRWWLAWVMAMGKPVVAMKVAGIPWMVEMGDTDGFADRLIDLLQDGTKRREMGQAARQVARQRFAADKVAEETLQVYRDLLGRKTEDD